MTLRDVAEMFHRAVLGTLSKARLFFLFSTLLICGVVVLFFNSLSTIADGWWNTTLSLFPLFFVLGLVLCAQVVLNRLYVRGGTLFKTMLSSSQTMFKVATFSLPLLILFLATWLLSGVFVLLRMTPYLGQMLGVILSFAPFLLHVAILALGVIATYISFVICPMISLSAGPIRQRIMYRLKTALFYDLLLWCVAIVPLVLIVKGLLVATQQTFVSSHIEVGTLEYLLESFVMMVPFVALMTPPLLFFFNFAAEVSSSYEAALAG